jgi:hypothetical protein
VSLTAVAEEAGALDGRDDGDGCSSSSATSSVGGPLAAAARGSPSETVIRCRHNRPVANGSPGSAGRLLCFFVLHMSVRKVAFHAPLPLTSQHDDPRN